MEVAGPLETNEACKTPRGDNKLEGREPSKLEPR